MTEARIGTHGVYVSEQGQEMTVWVGEPYKTQGEGQDGMIDFIARNDIPSEWIRSMSVEFYDQNHLDWVEGSTVGWRPMVMFYTSEELAARQPPGLVVIEEERAGFPWWILLAILPFL